MQLSLDFSLDSSAGPPLSTIACPEVSKTRHLKGKQAHARGLLAEDAVAMRYTEKNAVCRGRRVRTAAGEIDLIFDQGDETVFVEVKARRSFDDAAYAVSPKQAQRIGQAALLWLSDQQSPDRSMRFDVALIDRAGHLKIIENALSFDTW